MAEWVPPRQWHDGETVTAAWFTIIGRNLRELKDKAHVHCFNSQDEELKNGQWEVLKWDSDTLDNAGMHGSDRRHHHGSPTPASKHGGRDGRRSDTSGPRSARVVCPDDGLYLVCFKVNFASNAAGTRKLQLRKNSAESVGSGLGLGGTWTYDAVSTSVTTVWGEVVVPLERGDHVNLFAYQDCGDRLTVNAGKDVTLPAGRPDERLRLPRSAFGELLDDAGLDVPCCVF